MSNHSDPQCIPMHPVLKNANGSLKKTAWQSVHAFLPKNVDGLFVPTVDDKQLQTQLVDFKYKVNN